MLEIGIRPVHPAWTVTAIATLIAIAAVSLTAPVGRVVEKLRETARHPSPTAPPLRTTVEWSDEIHRLRIWGTPGTAVLVLEGDTPLAVMTLDNAGAGTLQLLTTAEAPAVLQVIPLNTRERAIVAMEAPADGDAASAAQAATPTRRRSVVATQTKPPPTARPVATATATAVPASPAPPPPTPTRAATMTPQAPTATATPIVVVPLPLVRAPSPTPLQAPPTATPAVTARATPAPAAPRDTLQAPPVLHLVPDAGARIALTFDGGAQSAHAADLLDTLARLDLHVTLFLTGEFIVREPALVRRAALAGHEIGNHTWSHSHLTTYASNHRHDLADGIDREWLIDELRRTQAAFEATAGRPMAPLWRAPFGEENRQLRSWALDEGYLHIRWSTLEGASLDSHDWIADEHSPLFTDSRAMMARLLRFPQLEGGIVLMHLSTERDEPPWTELPQLVAQLRSRGIEPVAVSRLLEHSGIWRPWLERARAAHQARAAASDSSDSSD